MDFFTKLSQFLRITDDIANDLELDFIVTNDDADKLKSVMLKHIVKFLVGETKYDD